MLPMQVREFLPGEPVVGDIVICTTGVATKHKGDPQEGEIYRVREISEEPHFRWGSQCMVLITARDASGMFSQHFKRWWSTDRFRATHDPQSDLSGDRSGSAITDERSASKTAAKTRQRLWHARQCSAWRDLCRSNLGLAVALAVFLPWQDGNPITFQKGLRVAASMSGFEICRLVGFPGVATSLRILSRLHQSWGQPSETVWLEGMLVVLRDLLIHDPSAAEMLLRHDWIGRLSLMRLAFGSHERGIADIFLNECEILRSGWLFRLPTARRHWLIAEIKSIEECEHSTRGSELLQKRRRMGTFQREADALKYLIRRQRMLDELHKLSDRLAYSNVFRPWPQPPLPGTDLIKPIATYRELVQEGKELDNCIATYVESIAWGVYSAYRMLGPVRCTIGLLWDGKRWKLHQILGKQNSLVEKEQTTIVQAWIQAHADLSLSLKSEVAKEISRIVGSLLAPRPFSEGEDDEFRF